MIENTLPCAVDAHKVDSQIVTTDREDIHKYNEFV